MQEIWKDIEGFEGYYQVSNMGHVRSLDRDFINAAGRHRHYAGKILVPCGHPYYHIALCKQGFWKQCRIHRLVAEAFIPNPNGYDQVDHIDCDKTNNRVDNLRWCTHQENTRYAQENGLLTGKFHYDELSDDKKLAMKSPRMVSIIRDDGKLYDCIADAARDMSVTPGAISHVLRGLVKTCKGHTFQYA